MSTFPTLKTGAVLQFPAHKAGSYSTQVVRFLDGSEQRYREYAVPLHRWAIQLTQLDETELNSLREFFRIQDGGAQSFSFTDPWDGTVYPSCSLDGDDMQEELAADFDARTNLIVKENRQ